METRRQQSVSVAVRVRPPHEGESGSGWTLSSKNTLHENANPDIKFSFDHVFTAKSTTKQIYDTCVAGPIVQSCLNGFNATVFAYGQTSSGKSYTMLGGDKNPGIVPLAVEDIFNTISDQQGSSADYVIKCSMLEIYNETLRDLLAPVPKEGAPPNKTLRILKSPLRGVYVEGAIRRIVTSKKQFIDYIHTEAEERRVTKSHDMNDKSSRSHCIVRIDVECWETLEDAPTQSTLDIDNRREGDSIKVSSLHLVDLAGSERISKTGASGGDRKTEGAFINKSLLFLGTVIERLSDPEAKKGQHIPYRDSLLTRMLESSLGGNSMTTVIAAITEAENHRDETRSTLQFAFRASRVRNLVGKNEVTDDKTRILRLTQDNKQIRRGLIQKTIQNLVLSLKMQNIARNGVGSGGSAATWNNNDRLVETLRKENAALTAEIDALKERGGNSGGSVNEAKFAEMKHLLTQYETQVHELEEDSKGLNEQLNMFGTLCSDLEADAEQKGKKVDRFRKEKKAAEALVETLRAEKTHLTTTMRALEQEKQNFAATLDTELTKLQTASDSDLKDTIQTMQRQNTELERQNRALTESQRHNEEQTQRQSSSQQDLKDEHKAELRALKEQISEQASLCRQLIHVTDELGEGKTTDPTSTTVKPREVDSAVKLLRNFIASRKHNPPGVVQNSSASFIYAPPVSQLKQLAKNNARLDESQATQSDVAMDEGFSDSAAVSIKGMNEGAATSAPIRRKRPSINTEVNSSVVSASGPSTPTGASSASYAAENATLQQRCNALQEALSVRDSQRDIIIDTKLKRMQDLTLRVYNNWVNLQVVVHTLADESAQLKEFVKSKKLSNKLPSNLKEPTPAADDLIAGTQMKPIRDHPSWPAARQ